MHGLKRWRRKTVDFTGPEGSFGSVSITSQNVNLLTPARESRFARAGNAKGLENIGDFAHRDVLIHTASLFVIQRFRDKLLIRCRLPSVS